MLATCFARLQGREIWSNHGRWVEEHGSTLADDVRLRLERCERLFPGSGEGQTTRPPGEAQIRPVIQRRGRNQETVVVLPVMLEHGPMRAWDEEQLAQFQKRLFSGSPPQAASPGLLRRFFSVRGEDNSRSVGVGLLTASGGDVLLLDLMKMVAVWSITSEWSPLSRAKTQGTRACALTMGVCFPVRFHADILNDDSPTLW